MTPWVSDLSFATKEGVLTFAMGLSGRNHYETLPLWSITECTEEQPKITQRFIYSIRRTSRLPAHIRNDIKGFMPSYFKIKVNVIGDTINPQSVSLLPRHSLLIAYENAWSFFHLVGLTRHRDPPPPPGVQLRVKRAERRKEGHGRLAKKYSFGGSASLLFQH